MSGISSDASRNRMMLKPGTLAEMTGATIKEEGGGIDQALLEKRLEGLRETQESIQGLSMWCQTYKRYSSAIIETWLKVLKKSPVEKRLTFFYLANDIVQHAKRKNDTKVVNQWAVAVQKATPLVRTPSSVSTAISRIFRIWEERVVYSKDTIADLLALLNNVPAKDRVGEKKKPETYTASQEKVQAFQASALISKIKLAYRLKSHLGASFRAKPFVHMDLETLKGSIKDRSHGMEVIQEIGQLLEQLKTSESKLVVEVEERRKIVEIAEIAIVHYENVRGEANIVNSAYKNFTERVEITRDKVIEKCKAFEEMDIDSSPVPSPPREAPSPSPDDDFGVPSADSVDPHSTSSIGSIRSDIMNALRSNTNNSSSGSATTSASQYDQNISTLAAIQQQFQNNWGTDQAGNFAAMSAMLQMLPAMQQAGGAYGMQQGYENYQATTSSVPDVSSIPLPPSEPTISPHTPSQAQIPNTTTPVNTVPPLVSPSGPNPYLSYAYDTTTPTDSNEYVPMPYYGSQDMGSSYGSEYDSSYQSSVPTTPPAAKRGRYQSYNNLGGSNNSSQPSSVSPAYSNHSGQELGYYNSGNSTMGTPTKQHTPSTPSTFDPMEMFASALSKNRTNSNSQSSPEGMNSFTSNNTSPNQSFTPTEPTANIWTQMYANFDEAQFPKSNGGAVVEVEPYTPRKPGMGNFNPRGTRGPIRGGALRGGNRGIGPMRGGRGGPPMGGGIRGSPRGGNPNSRGFFRGRGPRGPGRGGSRGLLT